MLAHRASDRSDGKSAAGGMFSGYFQTAAYNGLNGRAGRPGWKWGFIL